MGLTLREKYQQRGVIFHYIKSKLHKIDFPQTSLTQISFNNAITEDI